VEYVLQQPKALRIKRQIAESIFRRLSTN